MLEKVEVTKILPDGQIWIRETIDGVYHRRVINPESDISKESKEIKDFCKDKWTDNIKKKYEEMKPKNDFPRV